MKTPEELIYHYRESYSQYFCKKTYTECLSEKVVQLMTIDNMASKATYATIDLLSKLKEQLPEEITKTTDEYSSGYRRGHNVLLSQVKELLTIKE